MVQYKCCEFITTPLLTGYVENGKNMNYTTIDHSDIEKKYRNLERYIEQMAQGNVHSLIVNGPPGVGKTYSATTYIKQYSTQKHKSITGHMTLLSLYGELYRHKSAGQILVLDDIDSIMDKVQGLNILKAAMDTTKKKIISWESTSAMLNTLGLPTSFEFNGGVILITNTGFGSGKQKHIEHLNALKDRSFCISLGDKAQETIFKYICYVTLDKDILNEYALSADQKLEILKFIEENMYTMHNLSIRSLIKCAELMNIDYANWKELAINGLVKNQ
jgi:hypothetical protein